MPNQAEFQAKFWKALKSDRTVMLGLAGSDEARSQPMTALVDGDRGGPIWFFTTNDTDLAEALGDGAAAAVQFASKGHDLFASLEGRLRPGDDRGVIDRLWSPFVAAWFEDGKDDPRLLLLRFDPEAAQVWLNENSLFAGVRLLLGSDPKKDYADKVAEFRLS